jgi:hypothetical protein
MIYKGPGFLAVVYDLAPSPPPLSPLPSASCLFFLLRSPVELTDWNGGGGGRVSNHTTVRKPGPL